MTGSSRPGAPQGAGAALFGGASGRSGWNHPAEPEAPPPARDWLLGGPAERASANGAAASGADAEDAGAELGGADGLSPGVTQTGRQSFPWTPQAPRAPLEAAGLARRIGAPHRGRLLEVVRGLVQAGYQPWGRRPHPCIPPGAHVV